MNWKTNTIMEWSVDGGTTWIKVTDHGRTDFNSDIEDIGTKQRMVDATMRKYTVAKKRTFSWSWNNLPDKSTTFLANGTTHGKWLEAFYNSQDGPFLMRMREGSDQDAVSLTRTAVGVNPDAADTDRVFLVMFSEFSKDVIKRGKAFDLWNVSMAVEEV